MNSAAQGRLPISERLRARIPLIEAVDDTTWKSLAIFCFYRILLALVVAAGYFFFNSVLQLGSQSPEAVAPTLYGYIVVAILLLVPARLREPNLPIQVTVGVAVDMAAIVMIMHASGGVRSGLGILLLVSLASAGLITRGGLAFFHAAIASLAVLFEQAFQVWRHDAPASDFVQAAMVCTAFFATAGLGYTLARYAHTSQQIAEARTVDLANLSQINELVIRDMQDGIIVVDSEGAIRQFNPRVAQLLGAVPASRRPLLEEYAPDVSRLLEGWRKGSDTTFMAMRAPRGNTELQVHFVPIGGGASPPVVIFVEDVGRMRAQAQQMKLVALGRLTASIAHEIRNPLSSIGHAADLIREGSNADREGDERLLKIISDNVHRLDRMVQEVLYLNRRDRAQPEAVDPTPWMANFVHQFCDAEKVPEDTVDIQVRTTQRMLFDKQHLDQILWNLVRNAWRHGRKRAGSVRVVIAASVTPGLLMLDVFDDGPGVAPEAKPHLFEPFFTTDAQGTGLGLYIARELAEGNGARIEYVEGPEAEGHFFRLTLKGA